MNRKILIIDDCVPILNSLSILLEMHHYEVETAQDLACLLDDNIALPDILLSDYRLSGTDGSNILSLLKNNERLKNIPFILMSGDIDIEKISIFLGVTNYIAKPFNVGDLLNKIETCILEFGQKDMKKN